ncbi:MAG: penicillin acylase family protein [Bernardetiaceae bacterium]|nr:penicillin acylase family protein [Bernardetiaceae bacterium]
MESKSKKSFLKNKRNWVVSFLHVCLYLILAGALTWSYLHQFKPIYAGKLQISGLQDTVRVVYDAHAIPHIYAQNREDAFLALGYVHAQERLFQMEMIRRLASGRLSEILGKDFLATDILFRELDLHKNACTSAALYMNSRHEPYQKAAFAYLEGINQFISENRLPLEFSLLGIAPEQYKPEDLYLITGYMAFSFSFALRTEPILDKIYQNYDSSYLAELIPSGYGENLPQNNHSNDTLKTNSTKKKAQEVAAIFSAALDKIPVPLWVGSNSWILSPQKTASGKVLFANDTHIAYSQPSVWFEAHLHAPDLDLYGNFLAGFPFPPVGHTLETAWGLTMFENDDMDLYREKINPEDSTLYEFEGEWKKFEIRRDTIHIKGKDPHILQVRKSRHGNLLSPTASSPFSNIKSEESLSLFWTYNQFPSTLLEAAHAFIDAKTPEEFSHAAAQIVAPGLNIMYADAEGNIAYWAAAKLIKRPEGINSKLILDGTKRSHEPLGYHSFSENPQQINPTEGFIFTANQPQKLQNHSEFYYGYYAPRMRADRIEKYLESKEKFDTQDIKTMLADDTVQLHRSNAQQMLAQLASVEVEQTPLRQEVFSTLQNWKGEHAIESLAPTIYYKWLYHTLRLAMADELGEADFKAFLSTHFMQRAIPVLIANDKSVWWDNIHTENHEETAKEIITSAFLQTVEELSTQLGGSVNTWQWGKVHTLEHVHPIARGMPSMATIFNVGPMPVPGGMGSLNNIQFKLNGEGEYRASYGPAMRIVLDFADVKNSESINPTGQSGSVFSPFYRNQATMYAENRFRKQHMHADSIAAETIGILDLLPQKAKTE